MTLQHSLMSDSVYSGGSRQFGNIQESPISRHSAKIEYNHQKSVIFALGAAVFFGMSNFFLSDISVKNGIDALYPQCIICILLWLMHHGYGYTRFVMRKKEKLRRIQQNHRLTPVQVR
jgi:hypothetical protein